jgi:endonuclease YncB( thermonuclease family)
MGPIIPFRRRSNVPIALGAIAVAALAFAATTIFLNWEGWPRLQNTGVEIVRPTSSQSGQIDVIDGDTVRFQGLTYRLTGFDTPERGGKASCDDERRRAEKATQRLSDLIAAGNVRLTRVACACLSGEEGTRRCNYGRLCGSLLIGGRDVGQILISEGLAHSYVCGATSCPRRRSWCDGG